MSYLVMSDMYLPPVLQQLRLRIFNRPQCTPLLGMIHPRAPGDRRATITANENNLCLAIATHVDMWWLVIINEDKEAQTVRTQHHNHAVIITQHVGLFQTYSGSENSRSRLR